LANDAWEELSNFGFTENLSEALARKPAFDWRYDPKFPPGKMCGTAWILPGGTARYGFLSVLEGYKDEEEFTDW